MPGWFTNKKTAGQKVVQKSPAPQQPQLYPDMFIYICDHILETIYDNCYLRDMYKSLVTHGFVPPPAKRIRLNHYCPNCLADAFDKAWSPKGGSVELKQKWGHMITHPLDTTSQDRSTDRISALLMFHDLWTALNIKEMQPHYFNAKDDVSHDLFFAFRYWCKSMARDWQTDDPERRARTRLLAVLQEQFGWLAANDVQDMIDLYRVQSPDIEQVLPGTVSDKDAAYSACIQRFRKRTRASVLPLPLDLVSEYNDVLRAASRWSAELLGPPQRCNLHGDLLAELIEADDQYDRDQHARLERAVADINDEAMRFKIQLYELFPHSGLAKRIRNEAELDILVRLVDELEERAMLLRPLEHRLRQRWRVYVAFARPHKELIKELTQKQEAGQENEHGYFYEYTKERAQEQGSS
ncbi:hypothetical protein PG993_011955 [Apiospora rasikravindrae]|uniref:Uncharacterized protein n=1 Tax=Apiospora rasikravindrae TaxID=990691 RepID=A0ABR1S141_9PEZI